MREIDLVIFRWINNWPESLNWLMMFFSQGNKWWWVRLSLLALLIYWIYRPKTRAPAILAMVAWPVANAVCDVLKATFQMTRPLADLAELNARLELTSFGTASAHAATMMSIAMVFLFYHRALGWTWFGVAILVGLSRVFVGVHYPYQVLLGWGVGAFVGFVAVKSWQAYVNRRRPSRADESPAADQ